MTTALIQMPNGSFVIESRKRALEEPSDILELKRERTAFEDVMENGMQDAPPPPGQLLLKILVPGYAAGAIIGKGGQIIVQLQKETGAIIKLSKAKDFYPGTQDRVVLIQGTADGLARVHNAIITKVYEFPVPKDLTAIIGERAKQVKIIVPNTTAGLVIGKAGATVKAIMEESGSKVQLSQKPDGVNVQERVITIKGEKNQLIAASNIIIDKIKDDPQSASCPNISYSGVTGPIANANPTGSPYASGSMLAEVQGMVSPAVATMIGQPIIQGLQAIPFGSPLPGSLHSGTVSSPGEVAAFNAAISTLANYGYSLGGGHAYPHQLNFGGHMIPTAATGGAALQQGQLIGTLASDPATTHMALHQLSPANYLTTGHQIIGGGGLAVANNPTAAAISTSSSTVTMPNTISPPPASAAIIGVEKSNDGSKETIELSVPESLVGAILGKGGKTLVEYQEMSGTRIQISKKGEYIPGTRNRKVSISGKPPGPQTAQYLITQRLITVQSARAQQAKVI